MTLLKVHQDRCIGAGICVVECEDAFDQGEDGLVMPLIEEVPDDLLPQVASAARECPSQAIEVLNLPDEAPRLTTRIAWRGC
jgi:ferredoxin